MPNTKYSFLIEKEFGLKLNTNQTLQIERLIYEIESTSSKTPGQITGELKKELHGKTPKAKDMFNHLKSHLIRMRFPVTSSRINIDSRNIYLNKLTTAAGEKAFHPGQKFFPERLVIEKAAKGSYLEQKFREKFPGIKPEYIDNCSGFRKTYKLTPQNLKNPLVFIVKENRDFIKPCPCTKGHIGCGYWIFNLGFGCPFDCSYCYLQQYQNFPGIVLPSNVEDFFQEFDKFIGRLNRPIRIGTGEFCDSLALDDITQYSGRLIDYFRNKPVFFELKTKSDKIGNLLKKKPAKNIIISWSLNPENLIDSEEYGAASLQKRLKAAQKVQKHGFSIAFHFDPIIFYEGWEKDYKGLIEILYSQVTPPFAWISMGTLRFNRNLKSIIESRFENSRIIYGELLIGKDKKLRYPEFIREGIYRKMAGWIRRYDKKSPVYLCMESKDVWENSLKKVCSSKDVERYLVDTDI